MDMKKKLLIENAKMTMKKEKKYLKRNGFIQSHTVIFRQKTGIVIPFLCRNECEKERYFVEVRKLIKDLSAEEVINISDVWLADSNDLAPSQHPNRSEGLLLTASMPDYCLQIFQPYSRLGDKIIFGEQITSELSEGDDTPFCKAFVDPWNELFNRDGRNISFH
jgi:hypothetical protein